MHRGVLAKLQSRPKASKSTLKTHCLVDSLPGGPVPILGARWLHRRCGIWEAHLAPVMIDRRSHREWNTPVHHWTVSVPLNQIVNALELFVHMDLCTLEAGAGHRPILEALEVLRERPGIRRSQHVDERIAEACSGF